MTSLNDDFQAKVQKWLEEQGYPLEMRVAQALQQQGFTVIQSEYYVDPKTEQSRETDVFAYVQEDFGDGLLIRIALVIECKSSREKPWVLFTSGASRIAAPAKVAQRAASRIGRRFLRRAASSVGLQSLPLFQISDEPAYNITQAFTSGNDICYASATSVAAATLVFATKHDDPPISLLTRREILEIDFPVIVTDARLLTVKLDAGNSPVIKEIEEGIVVWRNALVGVPHTIIHILSVSALPKFVDQAWLSANRLLQLCRSDLRAFVTQAREDIRQGLDKL